MKNKSTKQDNIFVSEEEKTINWSDLQSEFKKNFGEEIYSSWLKNIYYWNCSSSTLFLFYGFFY